MRQLHSTHQHNATFFLNIFNSWLVESTDGEPTEKEGPTMYVLLQNKFNILKHKYINAKRQKNFLK